MVQLLKCAEHAENEEFLAKIDQLKSLREAGLLSNPDARQSLRGVSKKQVERLMFSDPSEWAPIIVTLTDRGLVIVDGYHRRDAMKYKDLKEIRAVCWTFESEVEVIKAAFNANRRHGEPIPGENRSAYAWYLHTIYPELTQKELAAEAGISQAAVSIAFTRREGKEPAAPSQEKPAPDQLITPPQPEPPPQEKRHESALQDWQTITRDIRKLLEDTLDDELTRRMTLMEAMTNIQDRDFLLEVAREIQAALAPPTPAPSPQPVPTPAPPPTTTKRTTRKKKTQ